MTFYMRLIVCLWVRASVRSVCVFFWGGGVPRTGEGKFSGGENFAWKSSP